MTLVLDAGALIALERADRSMWARMRLAADAGQRPCTHPGVVAQVWRGGARQARLAAALRGVDVRPLDIDWAKRCGLLLALSSGRDVVDAGVALLASDGDTILTSDVEDLVALVDASGADVAVLPV